MRPRLGAHGFGDLGPVLMVGEVDDLADPPHLSERALLLLGFFGQDYAGATS
jgi:hypothetical protein